MTVSKWMTTREGRKESQEILLEANIVFFEEESPRFKCKAPVKIADNGRFYGFCGYRMQSNQPEPFAHLCLRETVIRRRIRRKWIDFFKRSRDDLGDLVLKQEIQPYLPKKRVYGTSEAKRKIPLLIPLFKRYFINLDGDAFSGEYERELFLNEGCKTKLSKEISDKMGGDPYNMRITSKRLEPFAIDIINELQRHYEDYLRRVRDWEDKMSKYPSPNFPT